MTSKEIRECLSQMIDINYYIIYIYNNKTKVKIKNNVFTIEFKPDFKNQFIFHIVLKYNKIIKSLGEYYTKDIYTEYGDFIREGFYPSKVNIKEYIK